jgi:hypothetical protein
VAAQAVIDLAAAIRPIAAALLPGWEITCEALSSEAMDQIIPGALAICSPIPTRSIAHVRVVTPWPPNESLEETLWHEITHGALSPLTALIGDEPGAIMVEEQIVERLGKLLAKIPLAARLAVARAINTFAPAAMRARLSASAGRSRARGGSMDPETIKQLIEAIKAQDGEAALAICEKALLDQATGGAAVPEPTEPDGDEAAKLGEGEPPMNDDPKAKPAGAGASPGPETPAEPPARTVARRAALDAEHLRARKAADATVGITVRARLRELRQDGVTLPTNLEASLGKMVDLDAFEQRVSDLLEGRKLAAAGGTRARAEAPNAASTPAPTEHDDGPVVVEEAALKAEGFDDNFVNFYKGAAAHSKKNADALLSGARARRAGHRAGSKGAAS